MATAYEVRIPVRTAGPAVPVRDVLTQTLPGAGDFPRTPSVAETGDDDESQLLVSMTVNAAAACDAQLAGQEAVTRALRDAGLTEDSVVLGPADARVSG